MPCYRRHIVAAPAPAWYPAPAVGRLSCGGKTALSRCCRSQTAMAPGIAAFGLSCDLAMPSKGILRDVGGVLVVFHQLKGMEKYLGVAGIYNGLELSFQHGYSSFRNIDAGGGKKLVSVLSVYDWYV